MKERKERARRKGTLELGISPLKIERVEREMYWDTYVPEEKFAFVRKADDMKFLSPRH